MGSWTGRPRLLPYLVLGSGLLLSLTTTEAWGLSEALLSTFIVALLYRRSGEAKAGSKGRGGYSAFFFLFLFLAWTGFTGLLVSAEKGIFLLEYRRLLLPALAFMALKAESGGFAGFFRKALPLPALALALWVLVQRLGGELRPGGPWLNANITASALWACFLYLLPQALAGLRESGGIKSLLLLLVILAGAGATGSRGALIASLAALGWEAFLFWRENPGPRRTLYLAGGFGLLIPLAWPAWTRVLHAGEGDHLAMARILIYPTALRMALAQPLLGLGWGQFGFHYPLFKEEALGLYGAVNPHNSWLHVLCETGLPGLLLLGLGLGLALKALYQLQDPGLRGPRLALSFLLLHGLFEENLTFTGPALLALGFMAEGMREGETPRLRLPLRPLALLLLVWTLAAFTGTEFQLAGSSALEAGDPQMAARDFRLASFLLPLHEAPWVGEGESLLQAGASEAALALAQKARRRAPLSQDVRWLLCRCLLSLGRAPESAQEAQSLAALDPKNALHLTRVAGFLEQAGEREGARRLLTEAQRLVPGWDEPAKALERLGEKGS